MSLTDDKGLTHFLTKKTCRSRKTKTGATETICMAL